MMCSVSSLASYSYLLLAILSDFPKTSNQYTAKLSGSFHARFSLCNQRRTKCLLLLGACRWLLSLSSSENACLACSTAKLLKSWMSPRCSFNERAFFSATKCTMSRASAWASLIGGMPWERGKSADPVSLRREKQKNGPLRSLLKRTARVSYVGGVVLL